jgi:hypothetical protein
MRINDIILAAYVTVGILTFGHAYNNIGGPRERMHPVVNTYFAAAAAPVWPLYWSAIIQQN